MVTKLVSEKAGAPAVVVDRSGKRVRLRNISHALDVCLCMENKPDMRVSIQPNKWTEVPDEVYEELKRKFYKPQEFTVPDWEVGGEGERPKPASRTEGYQEYILEFSHDRED